MVGGEHAVERRGAREDRRLYTLQLFGEQVAAIQLHAPVATAVGVLQAPEELLGERRVVVPAGGIEGQLRYPGAVVARRIAEQPQARQALRQWRFDAAFAQAPLQRLAVARQRVARLVQRGEALDGLGEQAHEAVELVAVDTGHL